MNVEIMLRLLTVAIFVLLTDPRHGAEARSSLHPNTVSAEEITTAANAPSSLSAATLATSRMDA